MTRDEFIDGYCKRSGITREFFFANGDAVPCDCGEGSCAGWQYETGAGKPSMFTLTVQQTSVDFRPPLDLVIYAAGPREVVRFKPDGTIEMGEGYTPTEAAQAFIAELSYALPSKSENDKLQAVIAQAVAGRDVARNLADHYEDEWRALGATVAEVCGLGADDITHAASAAQNALRRMSKERDEALIKRDEWAELWDGSQAKLGAEREWRDAAKAELRASIASANGIDHDGPGSASFSRIFPEDVYPTTEPEADAFVKGRIRLWLHTWITGPMHRALRALEDSGGPGAAHDSGRLMPDPTVATADPPEPAGSSSPLDACDQRLSRLGRPVSAAEHAEIRTALAADRSKPSPKADCECLDWTQVGHPASAYWPDMHPNYHHPDCAKYAPPPPDRESE